ncbi:MAG: hypothetical protein M1355_02920 [Patescibacteria group bacterium]|nr:hypothetical protein [Patescibacteria group bacterium]
MKKPLIFHKTRPSSGNTRTAIWPNVVYHQGLIIKVATRPVGFRGLFQAKRYSLFQSNLPEDLQTLKKENLPGFESLIALCKKSLNPHSRWLPYDLAKRILEIGSLLHFAEEYKASETIRSLGGKAIGIIV